eukprot:gene2039-2653_t
MRFQHRVHRTLLDRDPGDDDPRQAGLRGEGNDLRPRGQRLDADRMAFARQGDDRAPLGGFVGQARQQRCFGQPVDLDPGERAELACLTVADGDRAGLVEQQHIDVARRLDRASRFGEDVEAHGVEGAGGFDAEEPGAGALEFGVVEGALFAVEIDEAGQAKALKVAGEQNGSKVEATLPARTILVAAGTQPNTVLAREDATHAFIDGKYFRALDEEGNPATPERVCKPADVRVLMYRHADNRFMSFFGDLHPSFAGNVVKAMGGAKQGYPVLTRSMTALPPPQRSPEEILDEANRAWRARVVRVDRLTPTIIEVIVEAPAA